MNKQDKSLILSVFLYLFLFFVSTYFMLFIGIPEFRILLTLDEFLWISMLFAADLLWQIVSFWLFGVGVGKSRNWLLANALISLVLAPTVEELISRFYLMEWFLMGKLGLPVTPSFLVQTSSL